MTWTRGRCAVLGLAVIAVAVVLTVGLGLRRSVAEPYWLDVLATGDEEEKLRAVEELGAVGTERSLWRVSEEYFRRCQPPYPLFTLGLPGYSRERPADPPAWSLEDARRFARWHGTVERAIERIRDRIGWERAFASGVASLDDPGADLRFRLYVAQTIVLVATEPADRPAPLRTLLAGGPADDEARSIAARRAKPQAVAVLVEALESDTTLFRRAAAFSLSFCGEEAAVALPALQKAATDFDRAVRVPAREAVTRIEAAVAESP